MTRREFPRAVKVACIKRATRDGVTYCEECGLPTRRFDIDHIDPDGLTGKPTLENARLLCDVCHGTKTKSDVAKIARAKRQEARNLGLRKPPSLKSRGFPVTEKQIKKAARPPREMPPRRPMFRDDPKPKAKPAAVKKAIADAR